MLILGQLLLAYALLAAALTGLVAALTRAKKIRKV
jgi:hypothetical protein